MRYYVRSIDELKSLRADKDGVVSFEYVILAACIITMVAAVFNVGTSGTIKNTLSNAMSTIGTAVITAVGG
nr:hypothetical protein [Bradyrhizobium japonicum]